MALDDRQTKAHLIAAVVMAMFLVLLVRLWQLQVIKGAEFERLSQENRLRTEMRPSPRGIIYDRYGVALVKNAPYYYVSLERDMIDRTRPVQLAELLGMDAGEIADMIKKHKNRLDPLKLKGGISYKEVAFIEARISDYPGLFIDVEEARDYPYKDSSAHLVGYLGKPNPRQAKEKGFKDIPEEAFIGQIGVERLYDMVLRGKPGSKVIEVDALGRAVNVLEETPAVMGEDLKLSIDMNLQAAIEREFGTRTGAAVAIRPSTGEVLAMVSRPSFDPNLFSRGINVADWVRLSTDTNFPLLNRAIQSQYPPGSTFKIMTAVAALETGAMTTEDRISCYGALRAGRWTFRCWKREGHGTLSMHRAIVESCDVFFYNTGERAGIDNIALYSRLFGLGSESGVGIAPEKPGLIPDTAWKRSKRNEEWYPGETYNCSIGQGYVLVTPLQLARMASVVANGGYLHDIRLTKTDSIPESSKRIPVKPETLAFIKQAMAGVVSEQGGTAFYSAKSKIVDIAGKTGTAQVVAMRRDGSSVADGAQFKDHAWFIAFAPVDNPEIAMAVLVEHGGHGGSAAAPIARKAIETYITGLRAAQNQAAPPDSKAPGI